MLTTFLAAIWQSEIIVKRLLSGVSYRLIQWAVSHSKIQDYSKTTDGQDWTIKKLDCSCRQNLQVETHT